MWQCVKCACNVKVCHNLWELQQIIFYIIVVHLQIDLPMLEKIFLTFLPWKESTCKFRHLSVSWMGKFIQNKSDNSDSSLNVILFLFSSKALILVVLLEGCVGAYWIVLLCCGLKSTHEHEWLITCPVKCGMTLFIYSQTPTVAPLTFEKG